MGQPQFLEGFSDRQAADAVRGRIDWKSHGLRAERLARNVRSLASGQVTSKLFGIPEESAEAIGLKQP
jgi:hypothetical protein